MLRWNSWSSFRNIFVKRKKGAKNSKKIFYVVEPVRHFCGLEKAPKIFRRILMFKLKFIITWKLIRKHWEATDNYVHVVVGLFINYIHIIITCFTIGYKTPYLLSLKKYLLREKKFEDFAPKCFFDHMIVIILDETYPVNKSARLDCQQRIHKNVKTIRYLIGRPILDIFSQNFESKLTNIQEVWRPKIENFGNFTSY